MQTLSLLMLALGGCGQPKTTSTTEHAELHELKVYDLPAQGADRIAQAFYSLPDPSTSGTNVPRFSRTADGRLMVLATPAVQAGVAEVLRTVRPLPEPPTIRIHYWIAKGWPAAEQLVPPELAAVSDVLGSIAEAERHPLAFSLVGALDIRSLSGVEGETSAGRLYAEHRASERDGQVVADVEISVRPDRESGSGLVEIETRLAMRPGQTIVLGQATADNESDPVPNAGAASAPTTYYFLMRASVERPDASPR